MKPIVEQIFTILWYAYVHINRNGTWHQMFIMTTVSISTYYVEDHTDLNVFT